MEPSNVEQERLTKTLRDAIRRRAEFAREQHPEGVAKPAAQLFWAELRSLYRNRTGTHLAAFPDVTAVPAASIPRVVMLLPGFGAHPKRMMAMKETLESAGHRVFDWGMSINLGPSARNFDFLMRRLSVLSRENWSPVALVGWSLGGLFAREMARRQPDIVSKVITMGTPFSGDLRANNAWKAYQIVTGHAVDNPPIDCDFTIKPPVPTIALWSPRDGIIHPRSACGWKHERDRAIALRCTHLDFASSPLVIEEVLRQLDVAE